MATFVVCIWPLQTVWTQKRPGRMSGLIWIQTCLNILVSKHFLWRNGGNHLRIKIEYYSITWPRVHYWWWNEETWKYIPHLLACHYQVQGELCCYCCRPGYLHSHSHLCLIVFYKQDFFHVFISRQSLEVVRNIHIWNMVVWEALLWFQRYWYQSSCWGWG